MWHTFDNQDDYLDSDNASASESIGRFLKTFGGKASCHKYYNLIGKAQLIQSNISDDLLFAEMLPIKNDLKNNVILLKNASDKVRLQISEGELSRVQKKGSKLVFPQTVDGERVEIKLLILKNFLDKE